MLKGRTIKLALIMFLCIGSALVQAASRSNFDACHSCHGDQFQGDVDRSAPGLAGQSPVYLKRQLENFAAKIRGQESDETGYRMQQMSILFSNPKLIADILDYANSFEPEYPAEVINGNPDGGKHVFDHACGACHGKLGYGSELLTTPALRYLSPQYFFDQIKKFQNSQRGQHPDDELGQIMQSVSHILETDQMIWDVIAYIQTLPRIQIPPNGRSQPYGDVDVEETE